MQFIFFLQTHFFIPLFYFYLIIRQMVVYENEPYNE